MIKMQPIEIVIIYKCLNWYSVLKSYQISKMPEKIEAKQKEK